MSIEGQSSVVQDPISGEFRRDLRILHVRVLTGKSMNTEEFIRMDAELKAALQGFKKDYAVLITGPDIDISFEFLEPLLQQMDDTVAAMKTAEKVEAVKKALLKVREEVWRKPVTDGGR
jgi:glycerol-3-phosphate O-acyltransferase